LNQDRIDQTKDGSIGADTKGKSYNGNERKAWPFE